MDSKSKERILGWSAAILVAIIWGVAGVVAKPLSVVIDPMTLVFFRYVTAVIGLVFIFLMTYKNIKVNNELGKTLKIDKADYLKIALCGIIGQGLFSLFNFLSLDHIGATENGVFQGLTPFITVIFGMLFMNFKMNKIQWGAFTISLCCIYAMDHSGSNQITSGNTLLGYFYVTCSVLAIGCTAHLRASLADKYGSVVSMLMQYIAVAIFSLMLVLSMGLDLSQISRVISDPLLLGLLIFLGTGISGLSYVIQLYAFKKIGVEKACLSLNLIPLVGYVLAVVALGETMSIYKTTIVLALAAALYLFSATDNKSKPKVALKPAAVSI
ncbi:DMT family transporter [Shewanella marina]|uniref:DMT family transporter n=1 Tax=Shewanella marina TaxID=487319 RepID=UPI00046F9795|nr:DMT family transporter [Shewanella marina]